MCGEKERQKEESAETRENRRSDGEEKKGFRGRRDMRGGVVNRMWDEETRQKRQDVLSE